MLEHRGVRRSSATTATRFDDLEQELAQPTDERIFAIAEALAEGLDASTSIHALTRIDRWFLAKIKAIVEPRATTLRGRALDDVCREDLLRDGQAPGLLRQADRASSTGSERARSPRRGASASGSCPCVKQIDTLAAEYPAETNYLYLTYDGTRGRRRSSRRSAQRHGPRLRRLPHRLLGRVRLVLGHGRARRSSGWATQTIMVNCNPETVSHRLRHLRPAYFEELSFERVLDIYECEKPRGHRRVDGRPDPEQPRPEAAAAPACASSARRPNRSTGPRTATSSRPSSTSWASTSRPGRS